MRKKTSFLISLSLVVIMLIGCGENSSNNEDTSATNNNTIATETKTETETTVETESETEETFKIQKSDVQVNEYTNEEITSVEDGVLSLTGTTEPNILIQLVQFDISGQAVGNMLSQTDDQGYFSFVITDISEDSSFTIGLYTDLEQNGDTVQPKGEPDFKMGVQGAMIIDGVTSKIKILNVEQISGTMGKEILAIEIEFTNKTDLPVTPYTGFAAAATVQQETESTIETMMGANGMFPADYNTELVEMGDAQIKKDATVNAVVGFQIDYPGEPIYIRDYLGGNSFSYQFLTTP